MSECRQKQRDLKSKQGQHLLFVHLIFYELPVISEENDVEIISWPLLPRRLFEKKSPLTHVSKTGTHLLSVLGQRGLDNDNNSSVRIRHPWVVLMFDVRGNQALTLLVLNLQTYFLSVEWDRETPRVRSFVSCQLNIRRLWVVIIWAHNEAIVVNFENSSQSPFDYIFIYN